VTNGTHRGIRLRITSTAGTLLDLDSDALHFTAKLSGVGPCLPPCLPGCEQHGWLNLTEGVLTPGDYVIQVRPVDLPDEYPDD
jgi:hypothetical protein